jgi:hypothetical protein
VWERGNLITCHSTLNCCKDAASQHNVTQRSRRSGHLLAKHLLVFAENRLGIRQVCDSGPFLEIFAGVNDAIWPVRHASMHDLPQTGKLPQPRRVSKVQTCPSDLSGPCSIDKSRPVKEARKRYWLGSKNRGIKYAAVTTSSMEGNSAYDFPCRYAHPGNQAWPREIKIDIRLTRGSILSRLHTFSAKMNHDSLPPRLNSTPRLHLDQDEGTEEGRDGRKLLAQVHLQP